MCDHPVVVGLVDEDAGECLLAVCLVCNERVDIAEIVGADVRSMVTDVKEAQKRDVASFN